MLKKLSTLILILVATSAQAFVKMPAIFSNNMVLQQKKNAPVWGWADTGEKVTVSIAGQKKEATADANGKWMVKLDPMDANATGQELTIAASNTITFKNVLIGEVWVCSGQSNMEWPLSLSRTGPKDALATTNPNIRLFNLAKQIANEKPAENCIGNWQECNPAFSGNFSAVAWYFGKELQKELNVPIGLIHTSWGGTPIEHWLSLSEMESNEKMKPSLAGRAEKIAAYRAAWAKYEADAAAAKAAGKRAPDAPGQPMLPACLYNGMIAPILPFAINGSIWYQGESNAGNAKLYQVQMPAMIKQWRKDFDCGEWPFLMVQLANFMDKTNQPVQEGWASLREAQLLTAQNTPKTGQAVIIDIGEAKDIHPRNKDDVGKRLALLALAIEYKKDIVSSGPEFTSMTVAEGKAVLKFKHVGGGLTVVGGDKLVGFAIAGADGKFEFADAKIDGETVVVSSEKVKEPAAVRYGWANNPDCNLYNKEGLPATPFRTDR